MKALIIFTLTLVVATVSVTFLPLSPLAIQILAFMLGSNAVMGLLFTLMAVSMDE